MTLTNLAIANAKPRQKPYKLSDSQGLFLIVTPSGGRLWRMAYRFNGKQKTLIFGKYPAITLAKARDHRDAARALLAEGKDPADVKKEQVRQQQAHAEETFGLIAEEWLGRLKLEGRSSSTLSKVEWLLEFAFPALEQRPISEITAPEVLSVLRTVEVRGRYESANRLRGTLSRVFRYAVATGRAKHDVVGDLRGALITPKPKHRAAILEPKALGGLLRAIDGHDGQPTVRIALRMAPHVFVRPGELRSAEWKEFDFETNIWTIPAEKTKMRRPHKVPLSRQVLALLREIHLITGKSRFLFPSVRSEDRPITDNTLNAALRRLGYDKTEVTAHGFRATASTLLNETNKWHPDAIERQLAHVEGNDVRRAYARGDHWAERIKMMQSWSDYLDSLRHERTANRPVQRQRSVASPLAKNGLPVAS
jgi:integrase